MTDPKTPAEIADRIAEDVRALNYATMPGAGITYPGDAYSTVGNLATAAMQLPQALGQIDDRLVELVTAELVKLDDGGDPRARVGDAVVALEDAKAAAHALYEALGRAQSALGPVAYRED